ncbi:mitochondrial import inner membrane translocase subunit tim54 [Plenodomus tracheiphilus IPT5]|uniref:Mitochondrial import inner membrane translocase subunit TIM54 n=1 Tax=Plenodomus tracheiphilus IPT5 TaxID=1408161 RepID=A0A6A7BLF2_9PLEO|nr:mitochondrial import inner membrane translocase subunit tim54 [Plenodomus tracheiphilus IPT5]
MAEPDVKAAPASGASAGPVKPEKPPNPVWRMMGLPNIRMKLPSRNWMIFLSVTGSWTAAVMYDRRQKKRIQQKWAKVVEDVAKEPLDTHQLPRKLTVYISAPPMDGLVAARDHFHEYVKPILVAAALDWDAIEGRREGDVRAGIAERIRKLRKRRGEPTSEPIEGGLEEEMEALRQRSGVREWTGPAGDVVIGRHTWKEYVRGLHEGWLGPLDTPAPNASGETPITPVETSQPASEPAALAAEAATPVAADDASPTAVHETPKVEKEKPKEEEKKSKKKTQPAPFITTAEYLNATLSQNCPEALGPAAIIPFPHLLGFLNFPIRMYRFLNKRQAADVIGRETAAAVLGAYRPFEATGEATVSSDEEGHSTAQWEQQMLLAHEEPDWHKKARIREEGETKERVWLDDMVLDSRIAERMRRFALDAEVEDRAKNVTLEPKESWFSSLWPKEKKKGAWEGLSDE